jgi:hypothetical protein
LLLNSSRPVSARAGSAARATLSNNTEIRIRTRTGMPVFLCRGNGTRVIDHGFLEADNNSAERAMRCVALGRKNYLFVGSQGGGKSAAIAYTLIEAAKLNGVNPQPSLSHVLGLIADQKITRLDELMPWR